MAQFLRIAALLLLAVLPLLFNELHDEKLLRYLSEGALVELRMPLECPVDSLGNFVLALAEADVGGVASMLRNLKERSILLALCISVGVKGLLGALLVADPANPCRERRRIAGRNEKLEPEAFGEPPLLALPFGILRRGWVLSTIVGEARIIADRAWVSLCGYYELWEHNTLFRWCVCVRAVVTAAASQKMNYRRNDLSVLSFND